MAHMLVMSTDQFRNPVAFVVEMKSGDGSIHGLSGIDNRISELDAQIDRIEHLPSAGTARRDIKLGAALDAG